MPKHIINESELKTILDKYLHSVRRDPAKIPNIQEVIKESLKDIAPDRQIEAEDIATVITNLSKKKIINDKVIHEAAKKVVDHGALEDLKFLINRNARQLGKKISPDDVSAIIKQANLNPHTSSVLQIKDAVRHYLTKAKPLEAYSPTEVKDLVKKELSKATRGPVDDRDVRAIVNQYLQKADQEKPFEIGDVKNIIKDFLDNRAARRSTAPPGSTKAEPVGGGGPKKPGGTKPGAWIPPEDPKHPTFFEKVRLKMRRYGLKSLSRGARNWLTDTVHDLKKPPARRKILAENQTVAEALIGNMFMYFYDAKTKDVLPYWDKFPLIFVIDLYEDGWLGLNVHYLPLPLRLKLFDKLLQIGGAKSLDKGTKLRLSYQLIKGFSQVPEAKPTIKRYLANYVKSDLKKIEAIDWEIAIFLPVEQFQKETKETVWKRSREKIKEMTRIRRMYGR